MINKDISALSGTEYTTGGVPAGVQAITDAALVTWAKEADIVVIKDASCYTPPSGEDCATWWKDKIETKLKGIKVYMRSIENYSWARQSCQPCRGDGGRAFPPVCRGRWRVMVYDCVGFVAGS